MRALLAVTLLLAVAAGGATSNPVFRREDGSAIVFPGAVRAWCDRDGLHALNLAHSLRQSHWQLDVARTQVRSNHAVDFSWKRPNGIQIFVLDAKTKNEASVGPEGSRGVVTLRKATCRRGGALEIGLIGTIASEFFDGKAVRVSGTFRGSVGPPLR